MYLRAAHAELDLITLRNFIKEHPLGIVVSSLSSNNFPKIQLTHIPWVLDVNDEQSETELGTLRGHMARANPHSKALVEAAGSGNAWLEDEVTVLFNGPSHSYVTPKFYVETKPATGKVVPTWNYAAAQVYGKARILFDTQDPETDAYLQKQVEDLTVMLEGRANAGNEWEVRDAPDKFVEMKKKGIMGIEVRIERLEGKFKMSQEMALGDREGVVNGFEAMHTENGHEIAAMVRQRGELKDAQAASAAKT